MPKRRRHGCGNGGPPRSPKPHRSTRRGSASARRSARRCATPRLSSLSAATCWSISLGTDTTVGSSLPAPRHQVLDGQRLIGEAHVHDRRRMPVRGREVDEPAVGEQVDPAAVRRARTPRRTRAPRAASTAMRASAGMSISTLKCPELQTSASSRISAKCSSRDHALAPGHGDEHPAFLRGASPSGGRGTRPCRPRARRPARSRRR